MTEEERIDERKVGFRQGLLYRLQDELLRSAEEGILDKGDLIDSASKLLDWIKGNAKSGG